jgi:xylulokinase
VRAMEIPFEKLPTPMASGQVAGRINVEAAEVTGLLAGTPVLAGCMDTVAASIGSGAVEPGDCFVIMGTAARVGSPLDAPVFDARFMNCAHVFPSRWLAIGALNGIGSSWQWIRDTFGQVERAAADLTGQNAYDMLTAEAALAPPGSKGLIFLPYLAGERTPIWNPLARGVFLGVTLGHTRNDVLRSVLEGTAFAIRQVVEILETKWGTTLRRLTIGGTAAASTVWTQIIADTLGKTVDTLAETQTEVLGAALLAGVSLGVYPSYKAATDRAVIHARRYDPNLQAHSAYSKLFPVYRDLYTDIEPYFERLARLDLTSGWVTQGDADDSRADEGAAHHVCAAGVQPSTGERIGR